jgi:hypothetical protein
MRRQAFRFFVLLVSLVFLHVPEAHAGGPVTSGSTVVGNLTGPGYSETWTFSGTIGDHVVFTAVNTGAVASLNLTLKQPGGTVAFTSGGNRVDFQLTATGTWTVVIDDLTSSVATTYNMTLLDLSSTLVSGSDADGGPIASSQILTGTSNVPGDLDAYTFSGTIGDRVELTTVTTNGGSYTPIIYLYPPGGGSYVLASGRLDYQLLATGTYTAVVQDQVLLHTGSFTLSYLNLTAGPLTNGSDTDGGPIASGSIKTGTISGPGDLDAFTFTGSLGDHVILAGLTTGGPLNTNISLYPPGGGAAIAATSADRVDAQLTASGTWTIVMEDYSDLQPGSYSLSLMDLQGTLTSPGDLDGGAITSNQILTGTTNVAGDFDAFTFTGTIGDRVLLTGIATGGPTYSPAIYLYPPGGGSYVTSTSGGRLDYQLGASGTYTAVVQDQNLVNTGTYEISYLNLTAGPLTTAGDMDGGPIASGSIATGTISGPGDIDAFTFTGNSGDHVILAAPTTSGSLNTNISLYPPGGGAAINQTSADRMDAQLTTGGKWTVVIEDYSDEASGTYSLSVMDLQGRLASAADPDSGVIASDQILTGTTNAVGDLDAFTFSGNSGNRVVLTIVGTSGVPYSPSMYIYPPGGGSYVTSTTNSRIDYQLTSSGTFTAVVQDQSLTHTGTYTLSYLNVSAGPFTNGSDPDGGPIAPGSIKTGTISGPGDLDAYTFVGSNGDHVIVGAPATSGTLNTNMTLYPPGGGTALNQTSADRMDATLTMDGTWTVVVEDYSDVASGAYSLSVMDLSKTLTSPGDPDGGPIASNQILSGTTNAPADFDAFTFNGVSGDRILMIAVGTSGLPYRPYVYLYPPDGGSYVTSSSGSRMDYQLQETGVYTAVVQDASVVNTGTYALSYLDVSAGYLTSGSDPDGTTIKPGDVKSGTIAGPGDFDAYWFTGNSGETAHFTLNATSGTLTTYLYVYPPDGTGAVVSTSAHTADYMLAQTGRYAIVVEDYSDDHTGTYQLGLTGSLTTVDVPVTGPKLLDPTHVVFTAPMPNPARGAETLTFSIPKTQPVELAIYDTRGALVRRLDHGTEAAGIYARVWDGRDERGAQVRPGVYFSELRAGGQTFRRALVRLE